MVCYGSYPIPTNTKTFEKYLYNIFPMTNGNNQVEKRVVSSVTEEGSKGDLKVVEELEEVRGGIEEGVRLEVAVTRGEERRGSKRLRGLAWGLLLVALGVVLSSAFVWRRRRRRQNRGAGWGGSSLGVRSKSSSTVRTTRTVFFSLS